jgi:hypothetical protein
MDFRLRRSDIFSHNLLELEKPFGSLMAAFRAFLLEKAHYDCLYQNARFGAFSVLLSNQISLIIVLL